MKPPYPPFQRPPRDNAFAIRLLAVLVAVALLAGVVALVANNSGEPDRASPSTTNPTPSTTPLFPTTPPTTGATPSTDVPSSAPPTTADPPQTVDDAQFLARVDELKQYVEQARGLPFSTPVDVELRDDQSFEAGLIEDFEEGLADLEDTEVFFRALGLLEGDGSLADELRAIYTSGVLGYYDVEHNRLLVRGARLSPYVEQTIVHELVHALDDQHFELFRPEYEDRDDEIVTAFSSILEGDARRVENDWLAEQPPAIRQQAQDEARAFGDRIDFDAFPEILLFLLFAPYSFGEPLVRQIEAVEGERAIDAALVTPPETTESILFYDIYAQRQPRVPVPAPPAGAELVDEGVVGAFFWFGLLTASDSEVNLSDATRAVTGWGGDWYVTWRQDDLACVRADMVGDTPQDTDEFEQSLTAWAAGRPGVTVSIVQDRVRLESCTIAAGAGDSRL